MKNNKLIIGAIFIITLIGVYTIFAITNIPYLSPFLQTTIQADKEMAAKNSSQFVKTMLHLTREGDTSELFRNRDALHTEMRVQSCLDIQDLISEDFSNRYNCYIMEDVNATPLFATNLIQSKVKDIKVAYLKDGDSGETIASLTVNLELTGTRLLSTDSSSDGSTLDKVASLTIKDITCTVDKDGKIIKTSIGRQAGPLTYFWDGYGDDLEIEWK